MTALSEHDAIRRDAEQRLAELRNVARTLWPDRRDPRVLSDLLTVLSQMRAAEQALHDPGDDDT